VNRYQLKIIVPFEAEDDVEARESARELVEALGTLGIMLENDFADVRLQKLVDGGPPRGLRLE